MNKKHLVKIELPKKLWLVKYSTGYYDSWHPHTLFATFDEFVAKHYVARFNDLRERAYRFYEERYDRQFELGDVNESDDIRFHNLRDTNKAWFEEVQVR